LLDGRTHHPIDGVHHFLVLTGNKGKRFATAGRSACSSDAVNVCIGGGRNVKVDDMRNPGNIDSTRGDVGGHHNLKFAVTEAFERRAAAGLGKISLQRR